MDFFDIIGWAGMVLVLLAYLLLSTNKIKNGVLYQSLNFLAAALMAVGLSPKNAWFFIHLTDCLGRSRNLRALQNEEQKEKITNKGVQKRGLRSPLFSATIFQCLYLRY